MDKILINIDTRNRDINSYPDSNFFQVKVNLNLKNIDYIKLASVEVPNLFYVFSESRHNLSFRIKFNIDVDYTVISIEPGNYSLNELKTIINANLVSAGFPNISMNFSSTNGLVTFTRIAGADIYQFDFSNGSQFYNTLGYYLGFRNESYIVNNTITSIIGEAVADVNGESYFFIRINDWGNTYISHIVPKKVLGKIILNRPKNQFIFDNGSNYIYKGADLRQPDNLYKLEIELLDMYGYRLENIGIDYSITLEIGQIYSEPVYREQLNKLDLISNKVKSSTNIDINDNNVRVGDDLSSLFINKPVTKIISDNIKNQDKEKRKKRKARKKKYNFSYIDE
jgi:hypothetical protein